MIVLAHVKTPLTITQLRIFDVPLMVFVSGLSYSGRTIKSSWSSFFWPRTKRIVVPVYIFLTFYFILFFILKLPLTWMTVINSYLLATEGGIGFVWIMRVFLLIMLVTPFLTRINDYLKGWRYYFLLAVVFILDWIVVPVLSSESGSIALSFATDILPYLLGYSILFMMGLRLRYCSHTEEMWVLITTAVFMLLSLITYYFTYGFPIDISVFKYPPTSYFLVYGIFVSVVLWGLRYYLSALSKNAFVLFVGKNTIWIYLWHILLVTLSFKLFDLWFMRYAFVYFGSIALYYVQYMIVQKLIGKYSWLWLKYMIG